MNSKTAWDKIITHCRWLGIPIKYRKKPQLTTLNSRSVLILATTNMLTNWQKNFHGAWTITLRFDQNKKTTWEKVGLLLHEIGHVLDYRDNMLIENRNLIEDERAANKYAIKTAKLLELPEKKVRPILSSFIKTYKNVMKCEENK